MVIKDAFLVAALGHRVALVLTALSLVYIATTIQTFRFGSREREGIFPLSLLFCLTFFIEAICRAGLIFGEGNTTAQIFDALKPFYEKHKGKLELVDTALFTWKTLGDEDNGLRFVLRVASLAFAVYLVINRFALGRGAPALKSKGLVYRISTLITVLAFSVLCGMAGKSCGEHFQKNAVDLSKPSIKTAVAVAENLHFCMRTPFGVGDSLVTIALLHASLAWTRASWIGLQHVLAFRWASILVHLSELYLTGALVTDLQSIQAGKFDALKFSTFAAVVQVAAVTLLFIPKFAAKQPVSFLMVSGIIACCIAVVTGRYTLSLPLILNLSPVIGQLFVFLTVVALILTGGVGMSLALFAVVGAAQVNAPWLRSFIEAPKM